MEDLQMFDSLIIKSNISDSYSVNFINNLNSQLEILAKNEKYIFLIDTNIFNLYHENFEKIESEIRLVNIDSSESNKTIDYCQEIIRKLMKLNIRKDEKLVAIGGGITQDIVAFISTILFRGIDWVFFPTTLLAQCDSCIGSKSSINFDSFKNLIGTFKPPVEIFVYKGFLSTLNEAEIRSGVGEMLHYFLTEGILLANQITENINEILEDRSKLDFYIKNSLRIKKKVIEIDEFDQSIRHIFNYGHTFGHALESITNYSISHGQAVTLGIDLANFISFKLLMLAESDFEDMHDILRKNMPVFEFDENNVSDYMNALSKDKKNEGNKIGCILNRGSGKVEKYFLENNEWLRQTILDYSKHYKLI